QPCLCRGPQLMRRSEAEEAERPTPEMWHRRLSGPLPGQTPASVGGAPGGAGPYVTGAAHPGWRARWHARAARAGPFAKDLPREPRKLPWGLANPWRLPALHHPRFGEGKETGEGRTRRPKTK